MRSALLLMSLMFFSSATATAQAPPPKPFPIAAAAAAARGPLAPAAKRAPQPSVPRDSVVNGTVIGALVGAAALGTVGGVICAAQHEPGTRSCWSDTFRIAGIGAAIGAGAGLAVDAAMTRQGGVRVGLRVRF